MAPASVSTTRTPALVAALVGVVLTCSLSAAGPSTAAVDTTEVTSIQGAVEVQGSSFANRFTVEDSVHQGNIAAGALGAMAAARPTVERIVIQTEAYILEAGPYASAGAGKVIIAATGFLVALATPTRLDDDLEADGALIITDHTGAPIKTDVPCRHRPRSLDDPHTVLLNSVSCPIMIGEAGQVPTLKVHGHEGDDLISFDLGCSDCLSARMISGGEGDDRLWGSQFDDEIIAGIDDDVVRGRDGDDAIIGFVGHLANSPSHANTQDADRLFGGAGSDRILGGPDDDLISGGPDNDDQLWLGGWALEGGMGDDIVVGGRGADKMGGGSGRDTMLARESDFGTPDELDKAVDCGESGGLDSVVRISTGLGAPIDSDVTLSCPSGQHPAPIAASMLRGLAPGVPWPWLPIP